VLVTVATTTNGSSATAGGIGDAFLAAGALAVFGSLAALIVLSSARSFLPKLQLAPRSMPIHQRCRVPLEALRRNARRSDL
jgi:hypothetical protein